MGTASCRLFYSETSSTALLRWRPTQAERVERELH